jgi:hypothetical protein
VLRCFEDINNGVFEQVVEAVSALLLSVSASPSREHSVLHIVLSELAEVSLHKASSETLQHVETLLLLWQRVMIQPQINVSTYFVLT